MCMVPFLPKAKSSVIDRFEPRWSESTLWVTIMTPRELPWTRGEMRCWPSFRSNGLLVLFYPISRKYTWISWWNKRASTHQLTAPSMQCCSPCPDESLSCSWVQLCPAAVPPLVSTRLPCHPPPAGQTGYSIGARCRRRGPCSYEC